MSAAPNPAEHPQPSRASRLLSLVRKLIDYGKEFAATLHQRAAIDPRSVVRSFDTADLALILVRIKRGLLRAKALEARLVRCSCRLDAVRRRRATPAARKPTRDRAVTQPVEDHDAPRKLPTEAEVAAWVRHRPIGVVIADICRDFGIACDHPLWRELQDAISTEGGNYVRLVMEVIHRAARRIAEGWFPSTPPAPAGTGPP